MRSRILTPRTAGILGIAGLTVTATVGFAVSAVADTSGSFSNSGSRSASASPKASSSTPSPSESPSSPSASATPTPKADWTITGPNSVKSSGTGTYKVTLKAGGEDLTKTTLTPHGIWHGGTVKWSGCDKIDGVKCTVKKVAKGDSKELTLTYSAPKTTKKLSGSMIVSVANDALGDTSKTLGLIVKKAPKPTPTKTSPSPTKSASPSKPDDSGGSKGSGGSHDSGGKKSHAPKPEGNGQVPVPQVDPPNDVPSSLPSVPIGSQPPVPNGGVPTDVPTLPSVAPSPEGSPRVPNVAEPPRKASGEVRTDAVSLPAAAAAAFVGIGAGTVITRSVRRRGLARTIGRHRD